MKKISFIYTSPYPANRGFSAADRRVRDLVRGLSIAGEGLEVELLIPHYHKKASTRNLDTEFSVFYLGKNILINSLLLNRIFFWMAVLRHAIKGNTEAVLFYNTQADSVLVAKILRWCKIKVVMEICDLHSNNDHKNFSFRTFLARWTEKVLPRNCDLVIVISHLLKEIIQKDSPDIPVMIVPILVDTDFFYNETEDFMELRKSKGDSFLISYVGGMWHHQGVRYLIAAFKKLIDQKYNVKLLLAGKYSTDENCDDVLALIAQYKLDKHVILPGWVQTREVKNILDCSDLLVICQTNNVFARAGLPTKLAEYAACGKAILITDVGDVKNYFTHGENCVLCQPESAESMADVIKYVIEHPYLAVDLGINAKQVSREVFDYTKNGKVILDKLAALR